MGIRILGAMTGTSCDGLDAVCVEFASETQWKVLWAKSQPYPARLRTQVLKVQRPRARLKLEELLTLDNALGSWYAKALSDLANSYPKSEQPHAIANHGQTIAHFPGRSGGGGTLQLGNPTYISTKSGLTLISHFREGDMAAGGQGAPLLPLFHRGIIAKIGRPGIAIQNLGGIANFSYVRPDGKTLAFDTGPANCWIDEATEVVTHGKQRYDRDGRLARSGRVDAKAVLRVLKDHKYFKQRAPKSTGRDDFPFSFLRTRTRAKGPDLVATATLITVESIAQSYEREILAKGWPLDAIYVCGGGARNSFLLDCLQARMDSVRVHSSAEAGVAPEMMEAQAFAWFGYLSLIGKPLGGEWTGVDRFGPPGWIVPGANWALLRTRLPQ